MSSYFSKSTHILHLDATEAQWAQWLNFCLHQTSSKFLGTQ